MAVGVYATMAPLRLVAGAAMSPRAGLNTGPFRSTTVTENVAPAELPSGSDAVQVTVVLPSGNVVLGAGEHQTLVPALPPSSAVGGMKKTTAPVGPVASTTMSCGTVKIGAPL